MALLRYCQIQVNRMNHLQNSISLPDSIIPSYEHHHMMHVLICVCSTHLQALVLASMDSHLHQLEMFMYQDDQVDRMPLHPTSKGDHF